MKALTRADLDAATCQRPGCDHKAHSAAEPLILHSRCHMGKPTWAKYADGELRIYCAVCDRLITAIEVKE